MKELWPKLEFYFMSLAILFLLLFANTIKLPLCFAESCEFIGLWPLIRLNPVPALLFILVGIAVCLWLRFNYKYAMGRSDLPAKIIEIEDLRFENLAFLATYLIPLIAFDPTKIRGALMLILVLSVIGWIFINTNTFYQNPSLAILGYKIYRVKTDAPATRIAITPDELSVGDYIFPRRISERVDFVMRERR